MNVTRNSTSSLIATTRRGLSRTLGGLLIGIAFAAAAATVEYTYDANGRLVGVYAPSGDAAQYVYDPAGNITQINRFSAASLAVIEFTPTTGPVGAAVSIYGTGFSTTPASNAVTFNGTAATVLTATANKLTTTVPVGATTGPIAVTVGAGTATSTANFVVAGSASGPTITSFSPASGVPTTTVTITGTGFDTTAALNDVTFNSPSGTATAATSTSITTSVPAYASSGKIKVRTKNGTATSSTDFLVPFGTFAASDIVGSTRAVIDGATATFSSPNTTKVSFVLFDGTQGRPVGVGITATTPSNGCANYSVRRPDNVELLASTQVCGSGSIDVPTLPLTGTYTLAVVSGTAASISGTITLSSESTGALGAEGTVASYTTARAGQNGRYTVSGTTGQKMAVYLSGLPSAIQPTRIDLIQPNGWVLASATSSGASAYIQIQTLPETGTYTVFVTPTGAGTGSWNIQYGQPDLQVQSFSVGTIVAAQNGSYSIPITAVVKNNGTVGAKNLLWYDELYISTDGTLDTSDAKIGASNSNQDLAAGATYTTSYTGTTSTTIAPGSYTLFFKTDGWDVGGMYSAAGNLLVESSETNNVASSAVTLPGRPDLVISNLSVGTITVNKDGSYAIPATFTVTNNGASAALPWWYDFTYLSTDASLTTADTQLGNVARGTSLAPTASYSVTVNGTTSTTVTPGSYTLFAKTDGYNSGSNYSAFSSVAEADETNNVLSTTITLPGRPDLTVSNISVGSVTVNQNGSYNIPVSYTVTNSGQSTAKQSWYDFIYLSTDGVLDTSDLNLGNTSRIADLAPGASYGVSITGVTPTTTSPGNYTIFAKTDGYNSGSFYSATSLLAEADETNNTITAAVTLPTRPDLTVTNLSIGTITVNVDGSYSIPITATVQNIGVSTAKASWWDECFLSTDATLDTTDLYLARAQRSTDVAPSGQYTVSMTCQTATTTTAGNYTLFFKADGSDSSGKYSAASAVTEDSESNNTASQSITLPTKP
jgi:YD repeat-containing protein